MGLGARAEDGGWRAEERTGEAPLDARRSGLGSEATPSVAATEGGITSTKEEQADPVIVVETGEGANLQNEVPPENRTEDGGRRAEERTSVGARAEERTGEEPIGELPEREEDWRSVHPPP